MHTGNLPVCNIALFGEHLEHFWMSDLEGLLQKFSLAEHPHKNNFFTILVINHARGVVFADTEKVNLTDAQIIILKPGCVNRININTTSLGKIVCFTEDFFSLRYNSNVLKQFSFLERDAQVSLRPLEENSRRIESLIGLLQEEYTMHDRDVNKVLRSYLNILLFELERIYIPGDSNKNRDMAQEKISEFEKLVEEHFAERKLPSSYADLLNVSTNYLNKLCKKQRGLTAGDIIKRQIIIEAQRLLYYTRLTINEISNKLGFENTSYFVTMFKKHTQLTPEQFRKSQEV